MKGSTMRIFLTGVSCVGKSTLGRKMGDSDIDKELSLFLDSLGEFSVSAIKENSFTFYHIFFLMVCWRRSSVNEHESNHA